MKLERAGGKEGEERKNERLLFHISNNTMYFTFNSLPDHNTVSSRKWSYLNCSCGWFFLLISLASSLPAEFDSEPFLGHICRLCDSICVGSATLRKGRTLTSRKFFVSRLCLWGGVGQWPFSQQWSRGRTGTHCHSSCTHWMHLCTPRSAVTDCKFCFMGRKWVLMKKIISVIVKVVTGMAVFWGSWKHLGLFRTVTPIMYLCYSDSKFTPGPTAVCGCSHELYIKTKHLCLIMWVFSG